MSKGILNWKQIRKELKQAPWQWNEELGNFVREIFLGTQKSLFPSGLEYEPWEGSPPKCAACDAWIVPLVPCADRCCQAPENYDGPEYHCMACRDGAFKSSIMHEADRYGFLIDHAPDDPYVFVVKQMKTKVSHGKKTR